MLTTPVVTADMQVRNLSKSSGRPRISWTGSITTWTGLAMAELMKTAQNRDLSTMQPDFGLD